MKQTVKKLLEEKHFSICTLRDVMEILGARPSGDAFALLHALHCVDYAKMEPELRARIPQLINECLLQQNDVVDATDVALKGVL